MKIPSASTEGIEILTVAENAAIIWLYELIAIRFAAGSEIYIFVPAVIGCLSIRLCAMKLLWARYTNP